MAYFVKKKVIIKQTQTIINAADQIHSPYCCCCPFLSYVPFCQYGQIEIYFIEYFAQRYMNDGKTYMI